MQMCKGYEIQSYYWSSISKFKNCDNNHFYEPHIIELLQYEIVLSFLTHKQLETLGCIFSTVATEALVLKHQAITSISTHNAGQIIIVGKFHTEILQL